MSHEPRRGPAFGSYPAVDVGWLLEDLGDAHLEREVAERELAAQSGRHHYAETLPVEYEPGPAYLDLFERALHRYGGRVATAVGTVTRLALDQRGPGIVLASLARAGTPAGILMRRWAARDGHDLPHYSISVVKGRGVDREALRYLHRAHGSARVLFVDAWSGKGSIARELSAAVSQHNEEEGTEFDPTIALLADPGGCSQLFGTRQDLLVPSACLNSTVSGLISRTVLNRQLMQEGDYHGAKFYRDLSPRDVSNRYVETIAALFDDVDDVVRRRRLDDSGSRSVTWAGLREVTEICQARGLSDPDLVKPGIGETTRVLLRRLPARILVRPGSGSDVDHVLALARERDVPVEEVAGLGFQCVGIVRSTSSQN